MNEGLGAYEAEGNTARLLRLAYHAKLRLDSEGYQGGGAQEQLRWNCQILVATQELGRGDKNKKKIQISDGGN